MRFYELLCEQMMLLDDCDFKCELVSACASAVLQRAGVVHHVRYGYVRLGEVAVSPHYWISLPGGWVLDYRLRCWADEDEGEAGADSLPHGVFRSCDWPSVGYCEFPVAGCPLEASGHALEYDEAVALSDGLAGLINVSVLGKSFACENIREVS